MKLQLTYAELSELAKEKADKIVELTFIESKTVDVKYTHMQKLPLCSKYIAVPVNAKITVVGLEDGNLYLSYDAGMGLDAIISGVLALYPSLRNMNIVEIQENQKAVVFLAKIDQVRDALDKINILDIHFDDQGVNVDFELKY